MRYALIVVAICLAACGGPAYKLPTGEYYVTTKISRASTPACDSLPFPSSLTSTMRFSNNGSLAFDQPSGAPNCGMHTWNDAAGAWSVTCWQTINGASYAIEIYFRFDQDATKFNGSISYKTMAANACPNFTWSVDGTRK